MKFYKHLSNGSHSVARGQTDRHEEGNCRFSQFCESAQKRNDKM